MAFLLFFLNLMTLARRYAGQGINCKEQKNRLPES